MSQRKQIAIKKWGRTVTFLDGEAGLQFPADSLNAKLSGLTYHPRDGFNEVAVSPSAPGDTYALLGLGHVTSGEGNSEFITVENRNGTIKAYSIDDTAFATRTDLKTDTTLEAGPWIITNFDDNAYLINFDSAAAQRVYRHRIGEIDTDKSLVPLQNVAYVDPNNPALTVSIVQPSSVYHWDATDTITYTGLNSYDVTAITVTHNADGSATFNGPSEDHGGDAGGYLFIETTFAANQDFSGSDYLFLNFTKEAYMNFFLSQSTLPELYDAATTSWHAVSDAKWIMDPADRSRATWLLYVDGMTFLAAVGGIKFRIACKPGRGAHAGPAQDFLTMKPIMAGGTYLKADGAGKQIWDTNLVAGSTTFGVVYWNGLSGGSAIYSDIAQQTIGADEGYGFHAADYTGPVGAIVKLTCEDPSGVYSQAKFLRLDESTATPKWREIATVATPPTEFTERHREYQVPALTEYSAGVSPEPPPTFSIKGVRYAFPFKQSMVWLTTGGTGNIHISRVGNPEEMYDSEITYNRDDLTQPAQRTLADNQADQPIWGVQAGANAFIVGAKAAYALQGDFPVSMSPSRQIPGSRGIAGPYAGCRFRPTSGEDGAAYLDGEGNVWLVNSVPEFTDDTRAKPFELSSLVRHKIRRFLVSEQLGEFPSLSITDALLEFQEATSSLWVILGKRAAVYRQDESGSGWEFYEYQLTTPPGVETISTCRDFTAGIGTPSSIARSGSTHAWGDPAYGVVNDDNEASAGPMTFGDATELLRSAGIAPPTWLPLSATPDEIHLRLRHRKVGDIAITHDWTKLTIGGTPTGANLALSEMVDTEQSVLDVTITSGLPTVDEVNSGAIGFETGYTAESGNPEWNDPANYTTVVVMSVPSPSPAVTTQNSTATITVDYIGPGAKPPTVDLDISANAWVSADIHTAGTGDHFTIYEGEGTVTDGLGNTANGSLIATELGVGKVEISNSKLITMNLTAGHGSFVLTSTGTVVNSGASVGIHVDYGVTAAMHPKLASTVFVDSMEISYCFTLTASSLGADSGISWPRVCFTPDSKYLAGRSSGQLDLIEVDFRNGGFIDGTGRDGGYPMPDWFLTLERLTFEGQTARLCGVQVNTLDPADEFQVTGRVGNGSFVPATGTGLASSRWVRFPVTQIGLSHQIKIAGDETAHGIDGLAIEIQPTSRSKVH